MAGLSQRVALVGADLLVVEDGMVQDVASFASEESERIRSFSFFVAPPCPPPTVP